VDSRFQVPLKEDKSGSTGQSWMETSSLWSMQQQGSQPNLGGLEWKLGTSNLIDILTVATLASIIQGRI